MKSIGCHDGVVVAGQTLLPAMSPQVCNNNLAENLIPLIDDSADRREERVSIHAVDLRIWVLVSNCAPHVTWAAAQVENTNGLAAWKGKRRGDQLRIAGF
jgi:hypothetical protein